MCSIVKSNVCLYVDGAGTVGVSPRVLFLPGSEGPLRGRPLGTRISNQYPWSSTDASLGTPLADPNAAEARAERVRQRPGRFGSGTSISFK